MTADHLEKRYTSVKAVDGVSFAVQAGEVFALLGPNGAGKSTVIRMLLGLIHPDAGNITYRINGGSTRAPNPRDIGYLPEDRGLYQDVPVMRTLVYFGQLRGMTSEQAGAAAQKWLERLGLADRAREPLKALSKGNQQKVQFISTVVHAPKLVLLDEPFSGLDPLNQDLMLELFAEMRAAGTTVLLSAHQMQLVERIADRLMVLDGGRAVLQGTMAEIRRRWSTGSRIVLRVEGELDLGFIDDHQPHVRGRIVGAGEIEIFVTAGAPLGAVLADAGSRLDIRAIETTPVTLHDVYVGTVGGAAHPTESSR